VVFECVDSKLVTDNDKMNGNELNTKCDGDLGGTKLKLLFINLLMYSSW